MKNQVTIAMDKASIVIADTNASPVERLKALLEVANAQEIQDIERQAIINGHENMTVTELAIFLSGVLDQRISCQMVNTKLTTLGYQIQEREGTGPISYLLTNKATEGFMGVGIVLGQTASIRWSNNILEVLMEVQW